MNEKNTQKYHRSYSITKLLKCIVGYIEWQDGCLSFSFCSISFLGR